MGFLRPVQRHRGDIDPAEALRALWFARIGHEFLAFCVRTPFQAAVLRRVESACCESVPGRTVVVLFHSSADPLLRAWCRVHQAAEIVSRQTRGLSEIRRLIRLLRSGRRVVVFADASPESRGCLAEFFGRKVEITVFPARLAAAAGAPLIPGIFVWTTKSIALHLGERRPVQRGSAASEAASREVIRFFEAELEKNPATWKGLSF